MTSTAFSATDRARAARALGYPYVRPLHAFEFDRGNARGTVCRNAVVRDDGLIDVAGRGRYAPVLATGSNASVEALRRKFGCRPLGLFQLPCRVQGLTVAHSAHVARYGAVPATAVQTSLRAPSQTAFLQLVPIRALSVLDQSESIGINYDRVWVPGCPLRLIASPIRLRGVVRGFFVYRSRHGPILRHGYPLPLGPQKWIFAQLAERLGTPITLEQLALRLARDVGFRHVASAALKQAWIA